MSERKKGCTHIYCGDGKGKTSAAVGLAVRAAGRGRRVLVSRFLKTDDSGEVIALGGISGITVVPCDRTFGFVFQMTEEEKEDASRYFRDRFRNVCEMALREAYDVVVFDELMATCNYGMVEVEDILRFLAEKPAEMEVVMTGRDPAKALVDAADYVSEIRMVKHPYTEGVPAREGIEY